jgi:hypothetical protein
LVKLTRFLLQPLYCQAFGILAIIILDLCTLNQDFLNYFAYS